MMGKFVSHLISVGIRNITYGTALMSFFLPTSWIACNVFEAKPLERLERAKLILRKSLQNRLNQHTVLMDVISSAMYIKREATELRNNCSSLFQQLTVINLSVIFARQSLL